MGLLMTIFLFVWVTFLFLWLSEMSTYLMAGEAAFYTSAIAMVIDKSIRSPVFYLMVGFWIVFMGFFMEYLLITTKGREDNENEWFINVLILVYVIDYKILKYYIVVLILD